MKKRPREGKRGIGQGDGLASLLKGDFLTPFLINKSTWASYEQTKMVLQQCTVKSILQFFVLQQCKVMSILNSLFCSSVNL